MSYDIVRTRGNYYEMGVQQGRQYRALVGHVNMMKFLRGMELIQAAKPIGGPPFNIVFNSLLKRGGRKMMRSIAMLLPNQYDRMEGIAEGFGITTDNLATMIYFVNFQGDMRMDTATPGGLLNKNNSENPYDQEVTNLNSESDKENNEIDNKANSDGKDTINGGNYGCSGGIIVKGDQGFIAKNFDFPNEIGEFQILRYSHVQGTTGYSTLTAGEGPIVGCISGMNEKGLSISWNSGYTNDLLLKSIPVTMIVQEALETLETSDQCIDFLKGMPVPVGAIFLILDKTDNKGLIIERTPNSFGIREMESGTHGKYVAASNSFITPEVRAKQIPEESIWTVRGIKGNKIIAGSDQRHRRITEIFKDECENKEPLDAEKLRKIMSDHVCPIYDHQNGGEDTVCRHGKYWKTLSSIYIEPRKDRLYMHYGNPCSDAIMTEYKLDFDYKMPNIRYLRRKNPDFPYFEPII